MRQANIKTVGSGNSYYWLSYDILFFRLSRRKHSFAVNFLGRNRGARSLLWQTMSPHSLLSFVPGWQYAFFLIAFDFIIPLCIFLGRRK